MFAVRVCVPGGPTTFMEDRAELYMFDDFIAEIAELLPTLLPQVSAARTRTMLVCVRGVARAELYPISRAEAVVVLSRRGVVELHGTIVFAGLATSSINHIVADLVGFFCGASVSTLSMFPHAGPKPKQRRRSARWGDQVPMRSHGVRGLPVTRTPARMP